MSKTQSSLTEAAGPGGRDGHPSPSAPRTDGVAPAGRPYWIAALLLLCALVFVYKARVSTGGGPDVAYRLGEALVPALVCWALFRWAFLRRRSRVGSFLAFLGLYVCFFIGGEIGSARGNAEMAKAADSVQGLVRDLKSSMQDGTGAPQSTYAPTSAQPVATGDAGAMEGFIKRLMGRVQAMRNDYLREIDRSGWPGILDPQRLQSDAGLAHSRALIKNVYALIDKYEKRHADLLAEQRVAAANLDASAGAKAGFAAGIERNWDAAQAGMRAQWAREREVVAQFEKIIDLLDKAQGHWGLSEGQLVFTRQADLDALNAYTRQIDQILAKQLQVQNEALDRLDSTMESIKKGEPARRN